MILVFKDEMRRAFEEAGNVTYSHEDVHNRSRRIFKTAQKSYHSELSDDECVTLVRDIAINLRHGDGMDGKYTGVPIYALAIAELNKRHPGAHEAIRDTLNDHAHTKQINELRLALKHHDLS